MDDYIGRELKAHEPSIGLTVAYAAEQRKMRLLAEAQRKQAIETAQRKAAKTPNALSRLYHKLRKAFST